jgi:hypothetical protein
VQKIREEVGPLLKDFSQRTRKGCRDSFQPSDQEVILRWILQGPFQGRPDTGRYPIEFETILFHAKICTIAAYRFNAK